MPQRKRKKQNGNLANIENLWREAEAMGDAAPSPSPSRARIEMLLRAAEETARPGDDDFAMVKAGFDEVAQLKPPGMQGATPQADSGDNGGAHAEAFNRAFADLVTSITREHIDGTLKPMIEKAAYDEIRAHFAKGGK